MPSTPPVTGLGAHGVAAHDTHSFSLQLNLMLQIDESGEGQELSGMYCTVTETYACGFALSKGGDGLQIYC